MEKNKEPSNKDEIPALCRETFISRTNGLALLWVLAGILISMSGTAVGWAMSSNKEMAKLESDHKIIMEKQNKLDKEISDKLNEILRRTEIRDK